METTDAEGFVTRLEYDGAGNVVKLKDAQGHVTSFTYNELGLLKQKTYADLTYEDYTYYDGGLQHTKRGTGGDVATYSYYEGTDDLHTVTYSDGTPTMTYVYNNTYDRLESASSGTLGYSYDYDLNARVSTVTDPWDNEINYTYDAAGRVHTIQVGDAGEVTEYVYDGRGRLWKVIAGGRTFTYEYGGTNGANMSPGRLTRPNGSRTDYTYDKLMRLTDIENLKSDLTTVLTKNHFAYNKAHIRTQETVTSPDLAELTPGVTGYTHNTLNQMTSANGTEFEYDDDGNMTAWTVNGISYTAEYDAENRMTYVKYSDNSHRMDFYYGPDGLLARQVETTGTETTGDTRFVCAGYLIIEERNASNEVQRSYVWDGVSPGGIGGLLEMTQNSKRYNYYYDGKGNVSAVLNADESQSGNEGEYAYYRYHSFGAPVAQYGTLEQPYQFSTKYYYPAFGIVKYQRRDYVAPLGRWAERDPIGEAGGINLYGFVGNSPMNLIDLLGLQDNGGWSQDAIDNYNFGMSGGKSGVDPLLGGSPDYAGAFDTVVTSVGNFIGDARHDLFQRIPSDILDAYQDKVYDYNKSNPYTPEYGSPTSMSDTWANYGRNGANWCEFQKSRDGGPIDPAMAFMVDNPVLDEFGKLPEGQISKIGKGADKAEWIINAQQFLKNIFGSDEQ